MGQPSTGAPATGWARGVIAASIAVLVAAAVSTIVAGDDDTAITRAGTSTTTPPTEQLDAPSSTAAPSDEVVPTTTAAAPASPSTSAAAAPPAPTDHAAPLRDRTFESVSAVEGSTERAFTDGGVVRVQFEGTPTGDVARWRISCNTAAGTVTVSADRLTVSEIGSSAAGCDPEKEAEDAWIGTFFGFGSGPAWVLDGSRLVLRSGDTVVTLDEVPTERFSA